MSSNNIEPVKPSTALAGSKTTQNAETIYESIVRGWDLPETYIGGGQRGVPTTQFKQSIYESWKRSQPWDDEETLAEQRWGTRHPFVAATLAGTEYEPGQGKSVRAVDDMVEHAQSASPDGERALIDDGVVKAASPVEVDPMIIDIQRSNAPVLDIIPSVSQAGFTAQFNQFTGRTLEDWGMTEADAADLTDNTGSSFTLDTNTKDMKIHATLINISDFSARAEESLDYLNLMDTTVGQVMKEIFLTKAATYFYGDPGAGGTGLHENANTFEGLAKFASDAGNVADFTGTTSGYLEHILDYLTEQTTSSGLTFGRAGILVSPQFYNQIYDEVTPVVRLDGYDADVEYGPQGLALGHERGSVPIRPCDNIRNYQSESSGVGSNSTNGDVFIYDEQAVQNRQLSPMSTLPLGRTGLSEKVAVFEYNTLIDKSLDETGGDGHTHRLRYGDV